MKKLSNGDRNLIRLQKILSKCGYGSRRSCEELILEGRVSIDGQIATLGMKANPLEQSILLDGQLIPGSKIILDMLGIEKKIIDSDLVITGEGQTDFQTIFDKAPISVSKIAKSLSIPCIAISGSLGEGFESVYAEGIGSISSILNKPMNFDEAIIHSEDLITSATEQAMKYLKIGKKLNID